MILKKESFIEFYEGAKNIYFKKENFSNIKKNIAQKMDEKENSTHVYLSAVIGMLSGEGFKFGIRLEAVEFFLDKIFEEFDNITKEKALKSLEEHIKIRSQFGTVSKLQEIYEKYKKLI